MNTFFIGFFTTLLLTGWACGAAGVPSGISAVRGGEVKSYIEKVSGLPPSVIECAAKELKWPSFRMADHGAPWNASDVGVRCRP